MPDTNGMTKLDIETLYPLVTEAMGQKISIGPPYFNSAAGYPALLLVVVMIMGPVMRWRRDEFKAVMKRIAGKRKTGRVSIATRMARYVVPQTVQTIAKAE